MTKKSCVKVCRNCYWFFGHEDIKQAICELALFNCVSHNMCTTEFEVPNECPYQLEHTLLAQR